jgi:Ca2+-binding RTX toxin-like protein
VAGNAQGFGIGFDTLVSIENVIGGAGDDTLTGNAAGQRADGQRGIRHPGGWRRSDTLVGGDGGDALTGGAGADLIDGGNNADILIYSAVSDSTGPQYDTINGFDSLADHIDTPATISGVGSWLKTGSLSTASFDADLAAAINAAKLGANHAVLFTADAGTLSGHTFVVVDVNGSAGYQSGQDLVMELTNASHLSSLAAGELHLEGAERAARILPCGPDRGGRRVAAALLHDERTPRDDPMKLSLPLVPTNPATANAPMFARRRQQTGATKSGC